MRKPKSRRRYVGLYQSHQDAPVIPLQRNLLECSHVEPQRHRNCGESCEQAADGQHSGLTVIFNANHLVRVPDGSLKACSTFEAPRDLSQEGGCARPFPFKSGQDALSYFRTFDTPASRCEQTSPASHSTSSVLMRRALSPILHGLQTTEAQFFNVRKWAWGRCRG